MTNIIKKLQNWFLINCNGDWEHQYGIEISNIDNPGWSVQIDLENTFLNGIDFKKEYQNNDDEHDWYFMGTKKNCIEVACGPENLEKVLSIFFDEVILENLNKNEYEIYLPLEDLKKQVWALGYGVYQASGDFKIISFKEIKSLSELRFKEDDEEYVSSLDVRKLKFKNKVDDSVSVKIKSLMSGITIVAI